MLSVRRRKVIPWILAAGAVASLVLVVVSWRDLLVRYYLQALRRNPAGFVSFLDAPRDTAKALALKAFVREPAGQQAVVSRFLDDVERATSPDRAIGEVDEAVLGFHGGSKLHRERPLYWGELRWADNEQEGLYDCPDETYSLSLAKLLADCRGTIVELPAYPGLKVEVLSLESAISTARGWTRASIPLPALSQQDSVLILSRPR